MPIGGPGGCGSPEVCMKYCADPSHRDECARFNPSAGGLPPGEMFRQIETGTAGIYGRSEDFERCGPQPPVALQAGCRLVCRDSKWESICANKAEDLTRCGPRPAMPTPQGCVGPVCKDGRWDFECKDFSGEDRSVGNDTLPPSVNTGGERSGILCTQEYNPVCGTNERTYLKPTSGSVILPEGREMMEIQRQIMPTSQTIYQQPGIISPPPEFIQIPPQSKRNTVDYFFATIFEGFGGLFRRR